MLHETLHLPDNETELIGKAPELIKKKSSPGAGLFSRLPSPRGFQPIGQLDDSPTGTHSDDSSSGSDSSSPRDAYFALPSVAEVSENERKAGGSAPSVERKTSFGKAPASDRNSFERGGPSLERKGSNFERSSSERNVDTVSPVLEKTLSQPKMNVERDFNFVAAVERVPKDDTFTLDRSPLTIGSSSSAQSSPQSLLDNRFRSSSAPVTPDSTSRVFLARPQQKDEDSPSPSTRYRSLSTPRVGVLSKSRYSAEQDLVPISEFSEANAPTAVGPGGSEKGSHLALTIKRFRAMKLDDSRRLMTLDFIKSVQSEESYRENPSWVWFLRIIALMGLCVANNVILMLPKLNDPAEGFQKNMVFGLFYCPVVTFLNCSTVSMHALAVLKRSLPLWKIAISSISSAISIGLGSVILDKFDVFPVPYWPITAGCVAVAVCLSVTTGFQAKADLKDPVMRRKVLWVLLMILLNVGSAFMYAFYVALFAYATGYWQTAIAPLLTIVKMCVKYCSSAIVRRLDNPDFRHGAALFPDLCGTCVSSIIFVNVNAIQTFLLLIAIDTAINLKHCLGILSQITLTQKVKHQRIVRALCVSHRDAQACGAALQELQTDTLSPELVELCGDLFFAEVTESVAPLIMGFSAWLVYYLPNCNRRWITYMWQNTEEDFSQGMSYVMLDCAVQLALFFTLTRYMYFKTNVPIVHVGLVIMNKHKTLFSVMIIGLSSFFFLIFLDHAGVDTTLQFKWLRAGYNASAVERLSRPCD